MQHSITFQSILIPIVIQFSVQRVCEHAQISHSHSLEEQPERIQVVQKILRSNTQCCHAYRRVCKKSRITRPYRCFTTQVRIPGSHILHHKDLLQGFHIRGHSIIIQRRVVVSLHICANHAVVHSSTLVSGIRTHQQFHPLGVTIHTVSPLNIIMYHRIKIVPCLIQRNIAIQHRCLRPSTTTSEIGQLLNVQFVLRENLYRFIKQTA